ncbi:helix-turn-helix domain-containing protein [uncultured Bradyrhizobium sp.]|jgi:transcriptional regulator with XRE-family HTH domain|uniref:helix-turn-helix domain-containing protein n=1 Tax=uncultured Bradyrhizobium sp. TaxID=199684 RepID=UPI002628FA2E|nr:helix-turn-helix domain-containing protein [uncultured Bradyrhizobium sp.]
MAFGSQLRQLRKERSMTATELAQRINVTPPAIWQWERRGRTPKSSTRFAIAKALGVAPEIFDATPATETKGTSTKSVDEVVKVLTLEELIRAIEAKGFRVAIETVRR